MYHAIIPQDQMNAASGLYSAVREDDLKEQMDYLLEMGYGTVEVSGQEFINNDKENVRYPNKVIITFDDGHLSNYTVAFPILKNLGFCAYFFIIVSKIGKNNYMTWQQIRELKDAGMFIGSHSMTHRIITELNDEEIDYELYESKKILEDNLGCAVHCFSVPKGLYNEKIIQKAKSVGFKAVFTSNQKDNNGFKFGRIRVRRNWDLEYFKKVIKSGLPFEDRARELISNFSGKILGQKIYKRIRTIVSNKNRGL